MEEINLTPQKTNNKKMWIWIAVAVAVAVAAIVGIVIALDKEDAIDSYAYVNYQNYMRIESGMTYNQVVEIMQGHKGELDTSSSFMNYTLEYYSWSDNTSFKVITVGFENGIVCTKSQIGL